MAGIRERAREELTAEIVRLARLQVEQEGAANLSLRAIARDLGMVSSAIYRYFASRDELLTRLIIDSYDRVGEQVEAADARVKKRGDFLGRWRAMSHALRDWAFAYPAEYALLFGTPVPGYAAPQDTIGPASRYTVVLIRLVVEMEQAGHTSTERVPPALRRDYARFRERYAVPASDAMLMQGMGAWAATMGAISLELFGHLHNVIDSPGALFEAVVEGQGRLLISGTTTAAPASKRA
ncbi:MAG: TetR/AcrR family transcriptional regulator [Ilumatobacteraceae bacterium]